MKVYPQGCDDKQRHCEGFSPWQSIRDNGRFAPRAQMFISSLSHNKPLIGTTREQISYDKNSNVIRLSDTRGLSTTTRNYAVQGNQVVQMIANGNNMGYPTYDERGNMTQNVEAGLQMSYNLCNLPKQITAEDGTLVNYIYFADGTKFKAVDATGNGFVYTGSLRWSVENGALVPESIAITGGRAVFADNSWATNYYITDHLGSVRAVTDAEGEVLDTFDYMPYGSEISSRSSTTTDYRFTGKERQSMVNNSIYDSFARFQNTYGRFMSIDPKAESFYHISPYAYCAGDPVNLVDPDGLYCQTSHPNSSRKKTILWSVFNPKIAYQIGTPKSLWNSISKTASNFTINVSNAANFNEYKKEEEGGLGNAFRHVLWQALITRDFGEEIAKEVGFIHEDNNKSLDSQVDIRNNAIGRKIGSVNKNSSNKSMAIIVIKEFYKNGF